MKRVRGGSFVLPCLPCARSAFLSHGAGAVSCHAPRRAPVPRTSPRTAPCALAPPHVRAGAAAAAAALLLGVGAPALGVSGGGSDYASKNYTGEVFHGDYRGKDFTTGLFRGCDFEGAGLRGVRMFKAELSGANMAGADLTGASVEGAVLKDTNLENAIMVSAYMSDTILQAKRYARVRNDSQAEARAYPPLATLLHFHHCSALVLTCECHDFSRDIATRRISAARLSFSAVCATLTLLTHLSARRTPLRGCAPGRMPPARILRRARTLERASCARFDTMLGSALVFESRFVGRAGRRLLF